MESLNKEPSERNSGIAEGRDLGEHPCVADAGESNQTVIQRRDELSRAAGKSLRRQLVNQSDAMTSQMGILKRPYSDSSKSNKIWE